MKRLAFLLAALGVGLAACASGQACDVCPKGRTPLSAEFAAAPVVAFGHVSKSQLANDSIRGTSEFVIDAVLKDSPGALAGKSAVTINRFVQPSPKTKYLVLADVVGGQFDPYRSFTFESDRVLKYLKEAPPAGTASEAAAKRLRYHFAFLNDAEPEIAADAFNVWATATNKEVSEAA